MPPQQLLLLPTVLCCMHAAGMRIPACVQTCMLQEQKRKERSGVGMPDAADTPAVALQLCALVLLHLHPFTPLYACVHRIRPAWPLALPCPAHRTRHYMALTPWLHWQDTQFMRDIHRKNNWRW